MTLAKGTKEKFRGFYESAHEAGALDLKTKELIHIALVLAMRCET